MRQVITPLGQFDSLRLAAKAHEVKPNVILTRVKKRAPGYLYSDEKPVEDNVPVLVPTEITIKGQTYNVKELMQRCSHSISIRLNQPTHKYHYKNLKSREDVLKVAMMTVNEVCALYPLRSRSLCIRVRNDAISKMQSDPEYIAWLESNSVQN
jgi:hypothetical protein